MVGIYKITSPSGKVYIGQSTRIETRFSTYQNILEHTIGRKLLHSLKKYTSAKHTFEVIHELPEDVSQQTLHDYERLYIQQFKECGFNMLNLTDGGEGSKGYKHTPDALLKMSIKGKGRFAGEKNPNYGKGCFGEKNGIYGKRRPQEILDKLKKAVEKPVTQYSMTGDLIQEFSSATAAARQLNLCNTHISNCCASKSQTAGGFVWKFKGDPFVKPINKNFSPVLQYSPDGELIKEWDSIKDAMIYLNIGKTDPSHISAVCRGRGRSKLAYGFIWKYKIC
jgi:group I intron endonuclease